MRLQLLMAIHADLKAPVEIGAGPFGTRSIFDVAGGTFEGSRLRGTILPSGGDWILFDAEGVGRLDVRAALATEDGARIYVQYFGVIVMNEKVRTALSQGGSTEYGDTYFMTQPRFETGDTRYTWLNRVMAVGEGRLVPNAVEYRVYELVNG
ncbi:MAG: DUF3237 domain-containing protein [Chloroflexi bacterium]|nr:DUF3237 domain-containing protein [Chloroflexota bacterium]